MRYAELSTQPDVLELLFDQPIFVGFKADTSLRRYLDSLTPIDKQYISEGGSAFLRFCRVGEDVYVGKLVHEPLTTDQVDDIRRNVMSIMQKLRPAARCPGNLKILACRAMENGSPVQSLSLSSLPIVCASGYTEEKCGP